MLIDSERKARLADFGFTRVIGSTNSTASLGTIAFVAAELFERGSSKSGVKVDIFAFGTLIYEVEYYHAPRF